MNMHSLIPTTPPPTHQCSPGAQPSDPEHPRVYLTRVVPWIDGAFVNLHWTVPNKKFDPSKPANHTTNKKHYLNGRAFENVEDALCHLRYILSRHDTLDIYVCMSSQSVAERKQIGNGRPFLNAKRGAELAVGIRSLYIDLDVKADGYPTTAAALAELRRFIAEVGLPVPTLVVLSGTGGAHVYWTLDKILPVSEWQPLANALAEATRRHGLKVDTACTVDSARLLRVPQTWNRKGAQPLPVVMSSRVQPNDVALDDVRKILLPYMGATVVRLPTANAKAAGPVSALAAGIQSPQAPPVDIDAIKPLCEFVNTALTTGGQSYAQPLWNLTTLLATFTQSARGDARWAAHEMAKGHPGYLAADTDALFDRKEAEKQARNLGWPSCAAIENAGCTDCAACPLRHLNKSPLSFGKGNEAQPGCTTEQPGSSGTEAGEVPSEDWAANMFAERYVGVFRYCHDTGKWYGWDGTAWRPDRVALVFEWLRQLIREACNQQKERIRVAVGKASYVSGAERFARGDERLRATIDMWDRDPFLLGTPGGTVDLRTGLLREAKPEEGITQLTAVAPAADGNAPIWLRFLHEVTRGDAAYIRFLQQLFGYCLTGDTSEQALFFAYGDGGNGKGVFIHVLAGILGEYATNAAMETFTAAKHDRHSTEIASLRGARLVTANETEQGRKWAESRIKQLTGGDVIRARFLYQNEFEFKPVLKLLIAGNNKPGLTNVDAAAKRRFNLLPFQFKPATPDPKLEEKLRAEWPQILRWAIDGALDWQRNGLVRPRIVLDATADYFATQDVFGRWIEERCEVNKSDSKLKATSTRLFQDWADYAMRNHEPAGSQKEFGERMDKLGFKKNPNVPIEVGNGRARGYEGVRLSL